MQLRIWLEVRLKWPQSALVVLDNKSTFPKLSVDLASNKSAYVFDLPKKPLVQNSCVNVVDSWIKDQRISRRMTQRPILQDYTDG